MPQDNPHDSLVLFTDLQHAAAVLLECAAALPAAMHTNEAAAAAAAAAEVARAFAGHLPQAVADAEAESSSSPSLDAAALEGPPGFRDLSISPSASVGNKATADRRMGRAVQLLQQAVLAAAAAVAGVGQPQQAVAVGHLQQLVSEALLPFRLQQLAEQLEAAAAAVDCQGAAGEPEVAGSAGISYSPSFEHRQLIAAYCSSKAQLARQLLPRQGISGQR